MPNKFLSPEGIGKENVLAALRIIIGMFLIYHGSEVFDKAKMNDYATWIPDMKTGSRYFIAYLGKTLELIAGIMFVLGLLMRIACLIVLATFLMITFEVGQGRIFMEDQYPFMFCLFAVLFLFSGAGKWSVDKLIFR